MDDDKFDVVDGAEEVEEEELDVDGIADDMGDDEEDDMGGEDKE